MVQVQILGPNCTHMNYYENCLLASRRENRCRILVVLVGILISNRKWRKVYILRSMAVTRSSPGEKVSTNSVNAHVEPLPHFCFPMCGKQLRNARPAFTLLLSAMACA